MNTSFSKEEWYEFFKERRTIRFLCKKKYILRILHMKKDTSFKWNNTSFNRSTNIEFILEAKYEYMFIAEMRYEYEYGFIAKASYKYKYEFFKKEKYKFIRVLRKKYKANRIFKGRNYTSFTNLSYGETILLHLLLLLSHSFRSPSSFLILLYFSP